MTLIEIRDQLRIWLGYLIDTGAINWEFQHQMHPDRVRVQLYTQHHIFHIVARDDYLGAVMSNRAPEPNETWTRGHDLPDGHFNKATWDMILLGILRAELIAAQHAREATLKLPKLFMLPWQVLFDRVLEEVFGNDLALMRRVTKSGQEIDPEISELFILFLQERGVDPQDPDSIEEAFEKFRKYMVEQLHDISNRHSSIQ